MKKDERDALIKRQLEYIKKQLSNITDITPERIREIQEAVKRETNPPQ